MERHSEQIFKHPFYKEAFNDSKSVLGQLLDPNVQPVKRSEAERYFWSVLFYMTMLRHSFHRLEQIRTYLTHFRILKQYKEASITRATYIEYHRTNHAIILVGISDIALILTSNVLRLGLPERQCRSEIITQNRWVRNSGIGKILQELNSAVEPLREPRHLYLHRGYPRDSELLYYLRGMEIISRADTSSKMVSPSLTERMYRAQVSRILSEIGGQEEPVFNAATELLTGLHPVYKSCKQKMT